MSTPHHIGLIAQGGAGWAGGAEYVRNLASAIHAAAPATKISLLCAADAAAEWRERMPATSLIEIRKPRAARWLDRFRPRNAHFTEPARAAGLDALYPFTYDNRYNVGVSFPLGNRVPPWAGWIPDFQHRFLPQLFDAKEIARREQGIAGLLNEASVVVLSSQSAARDLARFHPEHASKAAVLSFATFPAADWYAPYAADDLKWLPERFFLVSNQFWRHKNHLVLLEALKLLAARGVRPVVICTGQLHDFRDPDYAGLILRTIHATGLTAQVLLVGLVPRRMQIEMMRRCLAVVQPSLFEGWSTVVEDARVLGRPCLLSDLDVHQEQNPPGARFFTRDSPAELAEALDAAWRELPPGPDPEAEQIARNRADERIVEVGRTFLQIAARIS